MIEIAMARDHQIQPLDPKRGQGGQDVSLAAVPAPWKCGACVAQQGSLDSLDEQGIALSHVQYH